MRRRSAPAATTAALCLSLLATGCCSVPFEVGPPLSDAGIARLQKGMTKKAVTDLLGSPIAAGRNASGLETWTYYHVRASLPVKLSGKASVDLQEVTFQRVTLAFERDAVATIEYDLSAGR